MDGAVIIDIHSVFFENPIMSVRGERIESNVHDDRHLRQGFLEETDRASNQSLRVQSRTAKWILKFRWIAGK